MSLQNVIQLQDRAEIEAFKRYVLQVSDKKLLEKKKRSAKSNSSSKTDYK